jgi:hypothetical protein
MTTNGPDALERLMESFDKGIIIVLTDVRKNVMKLSSDENNRIDKSKVLHIIDTYVQAIQENQEQK